MSPAERAPRTISPLLLLVGCLFVATLVTSNIIAVKIITVGPFTVSSAIVLFPLAYLFGDVLTEVWGFAAARTVIWTGFLCNLVVVGFIVIAVALPSASGYPDGDAFGRILGMSPRIVGASVSAYVVGELLNSYVLARLKVLTGGRMLWTRTIGSTVAGQGVDSAIFITLAFAGVLPSSILLTVVRDTFLLKVLYEILATPLTYAIVTTAKRIEGIDVFDRDTSFSPLPWQRRGARSGAQAR